MNNNCGWCGDDALLTCGNCNQVFYCCKEHQKQHWPQHRLDCKPYKMVESPTLGRYLVASRFLPAGTLVIKESPFALGPQATSPLVCLGCHIPVIENNFYRCSQCYWPMCSEQCCVNGRHVSECTILRLDSKKSGVPTQQGETPRYDLILLLRCFLFRSTEPSLWNKILTMEGHGQRRKVEAEPHHVAAVRFMSEVYKLDIGIDTIHHVRGAIITNSIKTKNSTGMTLRGLYTMISLLNHSCSPNLTLRSSKDHTLYIRTSVDVSKGDPLLFSYVPVTDPIWRRQEDLKNIYYFSCHCSRCADPTEKGIYFSSPRCSSCFMYLEPSVPVESIWLCKSCGNQKLYKDVLKDSDDLAEWINTKKISVKHLKLFLKAVAEKCHDNHFLYVDALQKSLSFLGDYSSPEVSAMKTDIWRSLIRIHDVIETGLTRKKGISLIELAASMLDIVERQKLKKASSKEELQSTCKNIMGIFQEGLSILSLEPPDSTEDHWIAVAKERENKVRLLIAELS